MARAIELLAGAGLAGNEHGGVRRRDAVYGLEHTRQGRADADDLARLVQVAMPREQPGALEFHAAFAGPPQLLGAQTLQLAGGASSQNFADQSLMRRHRQGDLAERTHVPEHGAIGPMIGTP